MAPGVGCTVMRYFGISRLSTSASTTSALCPADPTAEVPQRISCCADAADPHAAARMAASRTNERLNMVFPPLVATDSIDLSSQALYYMSAVKTQRLARPCDVRTRRNSLPPS